MGLANAPLVHSFCLYPPEFFAISASMVGSLCLLFCRKRIKVLQETDIDAASCAVAFIT